MIFRLLALGACVSTPVIVLLFEHSQSVLRGGLYQTPVGEQPAGPHQPQQSHGPGGSVVAQMWGVGEWSEVDAAEPEQGSRSTTTSCPPCDCGTGGEPVPPQHLSIFGRFVFELILSEDVDLGRYVAVAALLYGAGAACVGWTLSSLTRASSSGERASSLAARGLRTRGVGYRAGLEAPGRI